MKHHFWKQFGALAVVALLLAGTAFAQTGKISGRIVDGQSRQALPGVNVVLEGTTLGAATDADGDYFIINIPPGRYTVQSSMVGYALQNKTEVLVQMDRTVVVDFQMGTEAVMGEEVTISAEHEIIKMDISGSTATLEAEEFTTAPISVVADYLKIQDGVEFERTNRGKWLSVRGGDRDETDFMVDGQSTMTGMNNVAYMAVSKTAIKEVSIQTGGFNAEYGRVRSGLVNVVTRDGSRQEYSLAAEGRYSFPHLKHFGRAIFDRNGPTYNTRIGQDNFQPGRFENGQFIAEGQPDLLGHRGEITIDANSPIYRGYFVDSETGIFTDKSATEYTPQEVEQYGMNPQTTYPDFYAWEGYKDLADAGANGRLDATEAYPADVLAMWMWEHQGWEHGNKPDYDSDVTLTGPLPGEQMNNKLGEILSKSTFMLSFRQQTSQTVFPTSRNSFKDRNLQAKITMTLTPTTKLRFTGLYGETKTISKTGPGIGGQNVNTNTNDFFTNDALINGGQEQVNGMSGGMRLGNSIDRGPREWFSNSAAPLANTYLFQGGAKLTHTVSPSTYFEMEYQYSQNVYNYNPMWDSNAWEDEFWIFNIDGQMNERGEPRTFVTDNPNDIFPDGLSQRYDPLLRRAVMDASGDMDAFRELYPNNINSRNVPFSTGGWNTWDYSPDLMWSWYDQRYMENNSRKGPNREYMARGYDGLGEFVPFTDPSQLPGHWEYPHPMNTYNRLQDPYNPANGGLMGSETLPGISLLVGQYEANGFRWGDGAGIDGFYQVDQGARQVHRSSSNIHGGKMTLVSQMTKHNQIKVGADFRFWQVSQQFTHCNGGGCNFSYALYNKDEIDAGADIWNIKGNWKAERFQQFHDNPFEMSAFIQDKIEVQGLIANVGLRLDVFDPTTQSVDFRDPYQSSFANAGLEDSDEFRGPSHFNTGTNKVKAKVVFKWSPRLGLSFPVTETSKVYFNYGWFFQRPPMQNIYQFTTWEVSNGVSPTVAPNPNLDWPRTIQMEMGYEQSIKGWFLVHAAGYYKDSDAIVDNFTWLNANNDQILQSNINNNYADVRGLEFRIDKNYGLFRARANFNYMLRTRGQVAGSVAHEDLVLQLADVENAIRAISENKPQPQPSSRITAGFFSPRNWGPKFGDNIYPADNIMVNMIWQWRAKGQRRHIQDAVRPDRDIWVDQVAFSNTDLRAEKRIGIGRRVNLGVFVQVFNLWNQKLMVAPNGNAGFDTVYKDAYESAFRYDTKYGESTPAGNDKWGDYKADHLSNVLPWFIDNIMFEDKRDVFYGVTLSFN